MSISASIDLKFLGYGSKQISIKKIIQLLLNFGWTLKDNGKVSYLPLGDDDNFNWLHEDINLEKFLDNW